MCIFVYVSFCCSAEALAFFSIMNSFSNLVLSLLAIGCITFVVVLLLAFMEAGGYTIGMLESVALTIVVSLPRLFPSSLSLSQACACVLRLLCLFFRERETHVRLRFTFLPPLVIDTCM